MEGPDFVLLGGDRPDQSLLGLGTHSEVHGKNNDPARHMVAFTSDNVEADWKRLKDAGVEFIQDPTTYGEDIKIVTLKDPEGNYVQIFEYGDQPGT